jgi:hypothetical protein
MSEKKNKRSRIRLEIELDIIACPKDNLPRQDLADIMYRDPEYTTMIIKDEIKRILREEVPGDYVCSFSAEHRARPIPNNSNGSGVETVEA